MMKSTEAAPNMALQQTAAAILASRSLPSLSAAAAAELGRSVARRAVTSDSNMTDHNHLMIASFWQTTCQSARSSGANSARRCGGAYGDLILKRTAEFCEQPTPATDAELSKRTAQSMNLTGINGSILSAADSAARHPAVASQIWAATKDFSDSVTLNNYTPLASMELTLVRSIRCQIA
jgi:hypothetical protein